MSYTQVSLQTTGGSCEMFIFLEANVYLHSSALCLLIWFTASPTHFFSTSLFSPTAVNPELLVNDSHPNSSVWLLHPCVRERQDPEHMAWSHRTSFTNKPLRKTPHSSLHGQLQPLGNRKNLFRQQSSRWRRRMINLFLYLCNITFGSKNFQRWCE